ncbi:MAG: LiaF transmembrane domain-containing protein [Saccharofermentanales bacterium]
MKNKNIFWGFLFLLSAVLIIAGQTGAFGTIALMSIISGVLLLALMVYSLFSLNFFGVFLPLAFLYMIFWSPLELPEISPWLLVLAAVLTSIGFSIIFHKKPKADTCCKDIGSQSFNDTTETIDDNHPYAKVNFGSSSKYLHSNNLEKGQFIASFGSLEVFFDKAQLSPEGAEIFLDCSFGAIKLYIPRNWKVIEKMQVNLGGVNYNNQPDVLTEDSPRLTLTGNVQLGGIEIQYI